MTYYKMNEEYVCECDWCVETRRLALEWEKYEVKTRLQKRMVSTINKIEKRIKKK